MFKRGEERKSGLMPHEVEASRKQYGANVFSKAGRASFFKKFLANLGDPVIRVLLTALFINVLFLFRSHQWAESIGIAASVLFATLISTLSEYGSEAAFLRLSELCGNTLCRVRRGTVLEIPTAEVVVGERVLLSAGEKIPADGVLFEGKITLDQSALTGESKEAKKRPFLDTDDISPASKSALFAGCTVLSGAGEMQVTAVGDRTYLGGISGELQTETRESPLKLRLTKLAHQISRVGYAAAVICALSFLFYHLVMEEQFLLEGMLLKLHNFPYMANLLFHAFMLGLTVVVVAVPEGLPMMIAVVLSANIKRMVKDSVLVRKPAGLEAAGSMNILFTDKTGTLTTGKISVCGYLTPTAVYGAVWELKENAPALYEAAACAVQTVSGATKGTVNGVAAAVGGNNTDRALLTAFLNATPAISPATVRLPFDSARKYAAVKCADGNCYFIGAPEYLFPHVKNAMDGKGNLFPFSKLAFAATVRAAMARGERTVLLCTSKTATPTAPTDLTLLLAVSSHDPLRKEARGAVKELEGAGIQVVMMTGDGKETAAKIATEAGILRKGRLLMEGAELEALTDAEVLHILPRLSVVSRALPRDKSRLVKLSESAGLVVGMTGDGINDAPALKHADVGFAMGSGTQVAKEAGDIVILDNNLSSIAKAVLYGRTIFKSIRKFITLQLIMNFCAVGISILGPFIGIEAPVTVVQMLWINIVMDTLGGLAFAGEAPMDFYMKEPPKRREEPILTPAIVGRIAFLTLYTVGLFLFFLTSPAIRGLYRHPKENETAVLLTAFFALFIFTGVCNCFNARTDRVRMLKGIGKNPSFLLIMGAVATVQLLFIYLGGTVLRTVPLYLPELLPTLLLSFTVIPVGCFGLLMRRLGGKGGLY